MRVLPIWLMCSASMVVSCVVGELTGDFLMERGPRLARPYSLAPTAFSTGNLYALLSGLQWQVQNGSDCLGRLDPPTVQAAKSPVSGLGACVGIAYDGHPASCYATFGSPTMSPASLFPVESVLPAPVLVVEDEPLLQQRLRLLLMGLGYAPDALVFASSLAEARACLAEQPIALALVDLALPDGSGLALIEQMRADDPALGILVVSAWSSQDAILGALRAGATGYVLKERDDIEVSVMIRSVLRGGAPIDPFIARRILDLLPAATSALAADAPLASPAGEALTERESGILRLVADGLSNREIAEQLFLSRYTVESHIKRIYRKLAVSSRTMAVREGRTRGVLG